MQQINLSRNLFLRFVKRWGWKKTVPERRDSWNLKQGNTGRGMRYIYKMRKKTKNETEAKGQYDTFWTNQTKRKAHNFVNKRNAFKNRMNKINTKMNLKK